MAGLSFISSYDCLSNQLINEVHIGAHPYTNKTAPTQEWKALWDTGATRSVVTKSVVTSLGLQPVSVGTATTPSGSYQAYLYYIDLFLPNYVIMPKLLVMEGQPAGCDILIGMDVIGQGDFAVSNYDNITSFSFRYPSCAKIDFVKHSYLKPITASKKPGPNEKCSCGSGEKYKKCCGKTDT